MPQGSPLSPTAIAQRVSGLCVPATIEARGTADALCNQRNDAEWVQAFFVFAATLEGLAAAARALELACTRFTGGFPMSALAGVRHDAYFRSCTESACICAEQCTDLIPQCDRASSAYRPEAASELHQLLHSTHTALVCAALSIEAIDKYLSSLE